MDELFGPIIGITLVLMSVFLPAAFLPGLTGRMYAQFALVIAATALLSAINAVTLEADAVRAVAAAAGAAGAAQRLLSRLQRGLCPRRARLCAADRRAWSSRSGADGRSWRSRSSRSPVYGFARVPTGFLPIEDQGYLLAQRAACPTAPRWSAPRRRSTRSSTIARKTPGVAQVVTIAGVSALDNSATLANAGVAYIMLKDWSERGKGEDLLSLFTRLNATLGAIAEARILVLPPPPIQGIGNAGGFTMQVELRDGSFDLAKLQSDDRCGGRGQRPDPDPRMQRVMALVPLQRAAIPHRGRPGEGARRCRSRSIRCSPRSRAISARATSTSSTSSAARSRSTCRPTRSSALRPEDIEKLTVRNKDGHMIPLGTLVDDHADGRPLADQPLQSLSVGDLIGLPAQGFSPARRSR